MNVVADVATPSTGGDSLVRRQPDGLFQATTTAVRAAARFAYDLLRDLF